MRKKRCDNCIYHKSKGDYYDSECHRYPPILNSRGSLVFPAVAHANWCGEYKETK